MSLLSTFTSILAKDLDKSTYDDGSSEYEFMRAIRNIECLYPESREIIQELCTSASVGRWDIMSRVDNRKMVALRAEIARRLKADVRLSNLQIGMLMNRSQSEVSGLLRGGK